MKITIDLPDDWLVGIAGLPGCSDGNCRINPPKGQHTNGGCNCDSRMQDALGADRYAARSVVRLIEAARQAVDDATKPGGAA